MIIFWKLDMVQFSMMGHTNYLKYGYLLVTAVSGGESKRLAFVITWNRTVNVLGGFGRNISMDLKMEQFNRYYKGLY